MCWIRAGGGLPERVWEDFLEYLKRRRKRKEGSETKFLKRRSKLSQEVDALKRGLEPPYRLC